MTKLESGRLSVHRADQNAELSPCDDGKCSRDVSRVWGRTKEPTASNGQRKSNIKADKESTGLVLPRTKEKTCKREKNTTEKKEQHATSKKKNLKKSKVSIEKKKSSPCGEHEVESWDKETRSHKLTGIKNLSVPAGESWGSMDIKPEIYKLKQTGAGDDSSGPSLGKKSKISEKCKRVNKIHVSSQDKLTDVPPNVTAINIRTNGKSATEGNECKVKRKQTDSVVVEIVKSEKEQCTKRHKENQKLTVPHPSHSIDTEVIDKNSKSTSSMKGLGTKEIKGGLDNKGQLRSPSPRDKTSEGGLLFTKRVLESVLKARSPSKALKPSRSKSAEKPKPSAEIKSFRVQQQRRSWPAAKVHLDHIYQAFEGTSQEDEWEGTLEAQESPTNIGRETLNKSEGTNDVRSNQELRQKQSLYQTKEDQKLALSQQFPVKDSQKEQMGYPTKIEISECDDKVTEKKLVSKSPSTPRAEEVERFTPQFIPRSISIKKCLTDQQNERGSHCKASFK